MNKRDLQKSIIGTATLFRDDLILGAEYAIMATSLVYAIEKDFNIKMANDPIFRMILEIIPPLTVENMPKPPAAWSSLLVDDDDEIVDELMYQWLSENFREHLSYYYMLLWEDEDPKHQMWMAIFARAWAYRLIFALHETSIGQLLYIGGNIVVETIQNEHEKERG